ncbi:hypothetical protein V6N11_048549 [Hibiscus sabdariffa]|uniref:ABC transmembrane type-1 domain-containing protein n=1 Tax=Hibiscus sabdariffa TaxID=183260 RepID=A0ABR2PVL9_9ROSI
MMFEKVAHQNISGFDDPANSSGAIGARLSMDALTVRNLVGDSMALIVQNIATVIAGLVIAFTTNWILAIAILAVMPFTLIQGYLQTKFLKGLFADAMMYEEASQGIRIAASLHRQEDGTTIPTVTVNIELEHVSFKYPTRADIRIFKDLCLTIHSGKTVALVGESGSGKLTVIILVLRFYDPDSGHVTLDVTDIRKLRISWLRLQMELGKATEEEIIAATKAANAHTFISSLPQACKTPVREATDCHCESQIKGPPKIFQLDEATSSLDLESEPVVQEALDAVMVNQTTVIVAHRLRTIKGTDIITVVKKGIIVEKADTMH